MDAAKRGYIYANGVDSATWKATYEIDFKKVVPKPATETVVDGSMKITKITWDWGHLEPVGGGDFKFVTVDTAGDEKMTSSNDWGKLAITSKAGSGDKQDVEFYARVTIEGTIDIKTGANDSDPNKTYTYNFKTHSSSETVSFANVAARFKSNEKDSVKDKVSSSATAATKEKESQFFGDTTRKQVAQDMSTLPGKYIGKVKIDIGCVVAGDKNAGAYGLIATAADPKAGFAVKLGWVELVELSVTYQTPTLPAGNSLASASGAFAISDKIVTVNEQVSVSGPGSVKNGVFSLSETKFDLEGMKASSGVKLTAAVCAYAQSVVQSKDDDATTASSSASLTANYTITLKHPTGVIITN